MAPTEEQQVAPAQDTVGSRLRAAREAAGLGRADIAARTRIAERHLISVEEGRWDALASRTYAVGFSRAYARAVGLDERAIADAVRRELAAGEMQAPQHPATLEPGDPARIPTPGVAWVAAFGALVVIGVLLVFWRSYFLPSVPLPDLAPPQAAATAVAAAPQPVATAAAPTAGPVVLTALQPRIWVKVYDAAGTQLFQKEMAQGESFTIPPGAQGPLLWTARPDALQVAVGGKVLPPLADRQMTVRDVPVSAAALLARPPVASVSGQSGAGAPAPAAVPAQPVRRVAESATPMPQALAAGPVRKGASAAPVSPAVRADTAISE